MYQYTSIGADTPISSSNLMYDGITSNVNTTFKKRQLTITRTTLVVSFLMLEILLQANALSRLAVKLVSNTTMVETTVLKILYSTNVLLVVTRDLT
jgi:hypothetical protein